MVQFYFLSILFNLVGGYALVIGETSRPRSFSKNLDDALRNPRGRLALGITSLVTGVFKFITPMRGDVRIVGDFFPAFMGILVGIVLLLEVHRGPEGLLGRGRPAEIPKEEASPAWPARRLRLEDLILKSAREIGFLAILAGILHFLFPVELFL